MVKFQVYPLATGEVRARESQPVNNQRSSNWVTPPTTVSKHKRQITKAQQQSDPGTAVDQSATRI